MFQVGIDMGGTFTDGFFTNGTTAAVIKVPTTHHDLTRSVLACLRQGADAFGLELTEFLIEIDVLRVATTIGTNAVVESTGDAVGLLVAPGAELSLYGSAASSELLGTFLRADQVVAVDNGDALPRCRELINSGVRWVVASLPRAADEHALREAVRGRYPEHYLRSIPLSLASEVAVGESDEMRTNTAVVNAYISRPMAKLLYRTEGLLQQQGLRVPMLAVLSDACCARVARATAISTYSSGPAAGIALVADLAVGYGDEVALGFDMGGTTTDLGLVRHGQISMNRRPLLRGVPVAVPVPGIESIGLGGSSIAHLAADGGIAVGPSSAGAIPGPACFGRGGDRPTLTDADLVLGLLSTDDLLAEEIELSMQPAVDALEREFDMTAIDAARAVQDAARRKGAAAVADLLEREGIDADAVTLFAFGGAGPLHGCGVAELVGIRRVRCFAYGSVFSARGVAGIDIRQRYTASNPAGGDAEVVAEQLVRRARLDLSAELLDRADVTIATTRAAGHLVEVTSVVSAGDMGQLSVRLGAVAAGPEWTRYIGADGNVLLERRS